MNHNPIEENPKDAVLAKIRAGTLRMRPKAYFILQAVLVAGVALLVLALSIFIASFIIFSIRISGTSALLSFGSRGLFTFFEAFPWFLTLIDIGLLVLLEWLLRRFRFAYSRSILYLLLVLVIVVGSTAIAVDRGARIHDVLFEYAEHEELPSPFQRFYTDVHHRAPEDLGLFRGVVVSQDVGQFVMTYDDIDGDEDEGTWTVLVPEGYDETTINIGDLFFVAGDVDDSVIHAYGLRELTRPPHR